MGMSTEKVLFLSFLAWLGGMFIGMAIEQDIIAPRRLRRNENGKHDGNKDSPKPFPVEKVKDGQ